MSTMPWHRTCIRCGGEMEEGYLLESTDSGHKTTEWVAGEPEPSVWVGLKTKGRRKIRVSAFRCQQCGALDMYAPDPT